MLFRKGTALIITADSQKWANIAAVTMTGFGTSVIGCGAECGIDCEVPASETPDGRPGVRVLIFGFSPDAILPQLKNRVGQCVLTSPGSACYNGLESSQRLALSAGPRFFGDGWQIAKRFGGRRFWRVPVMDGEEFVRQLRLREDLADVAVVVVSTEVNRERLDRMRSMGVVDVLRKPFEPEDLCRLVGKVMGVKV